MPKKLILIKTFIRALFSKENFIYIAYFIKGEYHIPTAVDIKITEDNLSYILQHLNSQILAIKEQYKDKK
jgi:hypothetical protein